MKITDPGKLITPTDELREHCTREALRHLAGNASDLAEEGLPLRTPDEGRSYRWTELPDVPIFLSGMLSGQRALDNYSKARLTPAMPPMPNSPRTNLPCTSARDTLSYKR
ncbi:MAG: hypothetical protein JF606_25440 [Burkholderiales bacterium]|nr:hypothetical protein [Burkholderiales bacterium]